MSEGPTPAAIRARLASISVPYGANLVEGGRLSEIVVRGSQVAFSISVSASEAADWEHVRRAASDAVAAIPDVARVNVVLTAERDVAAASPSRPVGTAQPAATQTQSARSTAFSSLADVGHVIAVASGKGGVGKSTTACNLALALALLTGNSSGRLRVGVLDADIYGPSFPKLLALRGQPRILSGRTLEPMEAFGLKVMSIGFLVDADKAMIWRGPMVASAITQMLRDVAWGAIDVLVVDMPPGTGDAQLTLAQQARLSGAVIVSTPQDLALIDARRGVSMFRDVSVPILGLIENMSYFDCDGCGKRHHPFAHGGARAEAQKLDVPFLGEIPLDIRIRERADQGQPIVVTEPDSDAAIAYGRIARQIWGALAGSGTGGRVRPA